MILRDGLFNTFPRESISLATTLSMQRRERCSAEMFAARKFNNEAGAVSENIYGAVTISTQWQF